MTETTTEDMPAPPQARAILTVDLNALRANYRKLRAMAAPADCAGVVKADAYGLGAAPVGRALGAEGCRTFFVATIAEARQLRALRDVLADALIYVLDGLLPGSAADLTACAARPVLGSLQEIEEWARFCTDAGHKHAAAIHIDTGMNRLGLSPADVPVLAARRDLLESFNLSLVMSHLVSGEEPGNPRSAAQARLFDELRGLLPAAPASLANSAGTLLAGAYRHDLTRPGIALYGGHVLTAAANPMQPVVNLKARILQLRDIAAGETIGYNETFVAPAPMRVATLATGYADGFARALSSTNETPGLPAYIEGYPAPLLGRVSMDYIAVDVSAVPHDLARRGAWAELIGPHVTIDEMAKRAGTNSYEILTSLGHRAARIYPGAAE